jgi:hypothetical protein
MLQACAGWTLTLILSMTHKQLPALIVWVKLVQLLFIVRSFRLVCVCRGFLS